ncbi:MAG: flippase [Candidatus Eisenbacteria bacterium]|nr:flippase [Candidatus Eisenbacteria bacterium]
MRKKAMQTTLTSRVAYNTIVQFVGKGITTVIGVITLGLLTRYLDVSGYGEYTIVFAFLGCFAVAADFGLCSIAVRDIAQTPDQKEKIFGNIFTLRIILGVGLLALAPLVAYFIPNYNHDIKAGIGICAFASFFILLNQTLLAIFQVNLRMEKAVIIDTAGRAMILVLVVLCIKEQLGFLSIIAAHGLGNLATFILSLFLARPFIKIRLRFDRVYLRHLIPQVLPLGAVAVLGIVYSKIDQIILSLFWSSWHVGIYGAPYKILEILVSLPAMFVGSVLPIISMYSASRDSRFFESLQRAFDFLALMALPTVFGVLMVAPTIIRVFAGREFAPSTPLLRILILAVGLMFFGTLAGSTIVAAGLQKRLVKIYVISTVSNIVLNLLLIPIYSFYAAAVITVLTEAWACSAAYVIVWRHLGWRPRLDRLSRATLAALVMSLIVLLLRGENLAVQVAVGGGVYFAVLFLTGAINREMMRTLLGRVD